MARYKLKPGIAACVTVTNPEGREESAIYLDDGIPPVLGVTDNGPALFAALPLRVRAEINKHFGAVFSLPVERRGEFLSRLTEWEVEA